MTSYSDTCTQFFLLKNGAIIPLDQIVLHDTHAEATHWNIFAQVLYRLA